MNEQLKRARLDRGWSQQEAANRLGVTQAYLSMLESGVRNPSRLARKLMQVYGLSPTVLTALGQCNLEARTAEGLPWVVLRYPDMPIDFLVREARARNLQNRLGFAVTLGRRAAGRDDLQRLEQTLADSKLEKEDSFCKELNDAERRWLREHSSEEARQWHLLSDLRPDAVRYAPYAP